MAFLTAKLTMSNACGVGLDKCKLDMDLQRCEKSLLVFSFQISTFQNQVFVSDWVLLYFLFNFGSFSANDLT